MCATSLALACPASSVFLPACCNARCHVFTECLCRAGVDLSLLLVFSRMRAILKVRLAASVAVIQHDCPVRLSCESWRGQLAVLAFLEFMLLIQVDGTSPDDVDSSTIEEVANCLKDSQMVEISEDGFNIRRRNVRDLAAMY
jgi:hypothetical protein